MDFKIYKGKEISAVIENLAALRIQVFREFPYLYEGDHDFEYQYLNKYVESKCSFIFTVWDEGKLVGASTCIALCDEAPEVIEPFDKACLNLDSIIYFGESILLKDYRNKGYGKLFMKERFEFAQSFSWCKEVYFCSIDRPENHPLKPNGYKNLHEFWLTQGFNPTNLSSVFVWKDINESVESEKKMNFWIKSIQITEAL
jgi:GNAT superfamily N-acetyltransferase